MDQGEQEFACRYRGWLFGRTLERDRAQAVWQRISNALELSQGPPDRSRPGRTEQNEAHAVCRSIPEKERTS